MCNVARIARKSAKKRINKKFGECITPIRYNAMNMYSQCVDITLVYNLTY